MEIVIQEPLSWVPILLYHRVIPSLPQHDPAGSITTATFESQLRWLARRGYRGLTISELVQPAAQDQTGPRVAITFDDGYEDNVIYALPLLKRYGFNATVFVVTDTIGAYNDFDAAYGGERVRMLSVDQIQLLTASGIEIGSHTCSHPESLPDLSDHDLSEEVHRSRGLLEDVLGRAVQSFAYPHHRLSERVEWAVAEAGYEAACDGGGTIFTRYCLSRLPTYASGGPVLEAAMRWRRLKYELAVRRRRLFRHVAA